MYKKNLAILLVYEHVDERVETSLNFPRGFGYNLPLKLKLKLILSHELELKADRTNAHRENKTIGNAKKKSTN